MRGRGTCEAWACDNPAVGHRANGFSVINLCADHLPPDDATCDVCAKPKVPDITGELRCKQCDEAIDDMFAGWREDAIARDPRPSR